MTAGLMFALQLTLLSAVGIGLIGALENIVSALREIRDELERRK